MREVQQSGLRIIRRRQVEAKTGLGRSAIYERISQGTFPAQVPLGRQSVGWLEHEIDAWIGQRVAEARSPKGGGHARG